MAQSFSQILFHIVFSTKARQSSITPDVRPRLYDYMGGIIRQQRGVLYAIGGMPDHVHLLIRWRTDEAVSDVMRRVKGASSHWVHETFPARTAFAWQAGYAAFSVSKSNEPTVKAYIENQEEHHRTRSFKEELLALLRAHGVEFEERWVFE